MKNLILLSIFLGACSDLHNDHARDGARTIYFDDEDQTQVMRMVDNKVGIVCYVLSDRSLSCVNIASEQP